MKDLISILAMFISIVLCGYLVEIGHYSIVWIAVFLIIAIFASKKDTQKYLNT